MSPNEEKTPPTIDTTPEMDICSATSLKKRRITNADEAKAEEDDDSTAKVVYVPRIKWPDLAAQIFIHGGFLYGLYLVLTQAKLLTTLWGERNFLGSYFHLPSIIYFQLSQFQHSNMNIDSLKKNIFCKNVFFLSQHHLILTWIPFYEFYRLRNNRVLRKGFLCFEHLTQA